MLGSKFISGSYAEEHNINDLITIGGIYAFNNYGQNVGDYTGIEKSLVIFEKMIHNTLVTNPEESNYELYRF